MSTQSLPIVFPVEVKIIPGQGSQQNRIVITTNGEVVADSFQHEMKEGWKEVVAAVCNANSRVLTKYGKDLLR